MNAGCFVLSAYSDLKEFVKIVTQNFEFPARGKILP